MQIDELRVHGFGKWVNRDFHFGTGINVVVAENEAGKSTLLEAIIALLYGSKRDYVKKAIKREEWQRYLPWTTNAYGGKISYRIEREHFLIERDLHNDEHRLYDAKFLRELSKDVPMDARKERNYMLGQIGLTRSLFEEITRIGTIGVDHHPQMMEWLHQQMGGNDEAAGSYQDVFSILEKKRREIGKGEMGKETRLAKANLRLKEAKEQLDYAKESMRHLRRLEERSRQLEEEMEQIISQEDQWLTGDAGTQRLQQEREQVLLSKQQMERYLQDIERLQMEEDAIWQQFNRDHTVSRDVHLQQLADRLLDERRNLAKNIEHCDTNIARLDTEMASHEGILPQLLNQQRANGKQVQKKKKSRQIRAVAYFTTLMGTGLMFTLPWYFGVGAYVVALLLFIYSIHPKQQRSQSTDHDYWPIQERLRQCQFEREELHRERLQLEKRGVQLREQEILLRQLQHMVKCKHELLLQLQVTREVDRLFVKRWQEASNKADYNEDLMIDDWVNRIKQMSQEIEQLSHMTEQQNQTSLELEELKREIAQLEGEMKNYQSLSLEEKENHYSHALAEKEELERKREIIDLADQLFRETIDEWNRMVSPDVSAKASEIFSALTLGKYEQVRTDPTDHFRLRVVEQGTLSIRDEAQLSRGTEQQLYLALRLALVDLYSKQHHLPIFLDDSFTQYDDVRLEQAMHYLDQLADKHQIFLFSCQSREIRTMDRLGISYNTVSLPI